MTPETKTTKIRIATKRIIFFILTHLLSLEIFSDLLIGRAKEVPMKIKKEVFCNYLI